MGISQIKMAVRGAQAARSLSKFLTRSSVASVACNAVRPKLMTFSRLQSICACNHRVSVSIPQILQINRRHYGSDHGEEESVEDSTMNVLKLFDKVDPSKVSLEAHFINDLGLDSLDVVEVVMAFEDEFGIEISDEEAEKIFTVQQAVELIKTKLD